MSKSKANGVDEKIGWRLMGAGIFVSNLGCQREQKS